MARVPIVRVGNILLATIHEDLHDSDALALQESLTKELERTSATGVLLDFSVVQTVDSFLGRTLNDVVAAIKLLGAQTVVVGIQPAVAVTLVELGLEMKDVRTALDTERGMRLLGVLVDTVRTRR